MANRHLSRSVVLQTLFEWDFRDSNKEALGEALERNAGEFASGAGDLPFMEELFQGVIDRRADLDLVIEKAAPEWPLDRIALVDRNVLRLGLYELLFADREKVPAKVAINEAIELAKNFGGENSGRFVNGVLGAVYKELGEPGKDEVSKKKKDVPYAELPVQHLGGAIVFGRHQGDVYLALVHDIFGHWTLSKGKIGDKPEFANETVEEGTIREIKEEMGLDIKLIEKVGENEYVASDPKTGKKRKHVTYFLAEAPYGEISLKQTGGLDDARWFRMQDALELNFYDDMLPLITKALQAIQDKSKK
ncbi:transcription antitermination factor NusB [Candidatus Adlerbacteria bacterium RIFOXYC1_FULL_48_26]|uniref:Transcription antitermination protein NusB n=1 Tax=Candidatus Adlerbacteria bacterium RIFOXYC1_FULL_48_26 TaxID=1797247 RepID=A0A1F4Y239_9BACT|nr:MAG: transcription antitermination factor NusB [Candidatus Adlerbacteria bacterium RIFOXYC1_FULL_48_26]OGC94603.1 MAG: transcription antitermination factor NusB [Candidatus Adlerbacteria bacterium RIFOXYB1_FULL_48_10]